MLPHDIYIEAFLGSGAILRRKKVAIRSIGIDLDSSLLDKSLYPGVELLCTDAPGYIDAFDYAGSAGLVSSIVMFGYAGSCILVIQLSMPTICTVFRINYIL